MSKRIVWKNSDEDLDKLKKVSHKDLISSQNLKKYRRPDLGGKKQSIKCNLDGYRNPTLGGKANTKEQLSNKGKLGGIKSKELGLGVHGLSDEERKINGKKGNAARKTKGHPPTTPILVFKDDKLIKEYKSISECARDMNLDKGNINKVVKKKYKQYKGYVFRYKK